MTPSLSTGRRAVLLATALLGLLASPAMPAAVCPPCEPPEIVIQVPLEGRNYAGPAKYEGDIPDAFGKAFTVELLIDGVLKPVVTLSVMNPGVHQFLRWTTAALQLARGPHTMIITVTDLADAACPSITTVHFATR